MNDLRRRVLEFEQREPRLPIDTHKAHLIYETLGLRAGAYLAHLMRALSDPEADAIAPDLVAARAPQVARLRQLAVLVPDVEPATWPQVEEVVHVG